MTRSNPATIVPGVSVTNDAARNVAPYSEPSSYDTSMMGCGQPQMAQQQQLPNLLRNNFSSSRLPPDFLQQKLISPPAEKTQQMAMPSCSISVPQQMHGQGYMGTMPMHGQACAALQQPAMHQKQPVIVVALPQGAVNMGCQQQAMLPGQWGVVAMDSSPEASAAQSPPAASQWQGCDFEAVQGHGQMMCPSNLPPPVQVVQQPEAELAPGGITWMLATENSMCVSTAQSKQQPYAALEVGMWTPSNESVGGSVFTAAGPPPSDYAGRSDPSVDSPVTSFGMPLAEAAVLADTPTHQLSFSARPERFQWADVAFEEEAGLPVPSIATQRRRRRGTRGGKQPGAAGGTDAASEQPRNDQQTTAAAKATTTPYVPVHQTAEELEEQWPAGSTTIMLRNIPNRYTAEELLAEVISHGFKGTFDFVYLPIDFNTKRNRGYAFFNFHTAAMALRFLQVFHNQQLSRYISRKILEVSAAVTQGFENNVTQFVRKDAQRIQNPWFRPMIFNRPDEEDEEEVEQEEDDEQQDKEEKEEVDDEAVTNAL